MLWMRACIFNPFPILGIITIWPAIQSGGALQLSSSINTACQGIYNASAWRMFLQTPLLGIDPTNTGYGFVTLTMIDVK